MTTATAVVLLVAAILTALRVPAFTKGRGRPLVLSGLLVIVAFTMITPAVYGALDTIIPGENLPDPASKIILFVAVVLLGDQLAKGLDSPRLLRYISGLPGRIVFAGASALLLVLFVAADVQASSPQLEIAVDEPVVAWYTAVTLMYLSYLSVLLLVAVVRSIGHTQFGDGREQLRAARIDTRGRVLMAIGFALVPVRLVLTSLTFASPDTYQAAQFVPLGTLAFVTVGLAFIRVARRVARRTNGVISFVEMLGRNSARTEDPWRD